VAAGAALVLAGCASTPIRPVATAPPAAQMAEFWTDVDPASRDLFWGAGGRENAPDPSTRWSFVARDSTGFSKGFDLKDEQGVEWSAKVGVEARTEVVASRLMWALGFHQPPSYYVASWTLHGDTGWAGPQGPARFRPAPSWMKRGAEWSWHQNPFTGTPPWRGALVMMVLFNNSDLKPSQNAIYDLDPPREGARRWYVVRDLGQALGETGTLFPQRGDIEKFERQGFVLGVEGGRVRFDYSGRWKELFRDLTPADVKWTCQRLDRLTPRQWDDAFRAGGYAPELAARFIRRFRQKIDQGLALPG
jgi:hypothetical protein